jgi:hypothetical protein
MYLFGGFIDGDRVDCVFKFNFKSGEWKALIVADGDPKPSARAGHSAVCYIEEESGRAYMYVFGGKDNEDNKLNDLWRMSLDTETWEAVHLDDSLPQQVPMGRVGHSSAIYNGHLVVFGGIFEITKELNDSHIFNLKTRVWTKLCSAASDSDQNQLRFSPELNKKKTRRDDSPDPTMANT